MAIPKMFSAANFQEFHLVKKIITIVAMTKKAIAMKVKVYREERLLIKSPTGVREYMI